MIKRNLHNIDIAIRIIIGATLVYVAFIDTGHIHNNTIRILLGIFGAINIVVALMRSCPMYTLAGLSTFNEKPEDKD